LRIYEEQVADGYSVLFIQKVLVIKMVSFKRFHKGAFYLAEKLNIDILPIVLHGTGYCMTKGEFLLKRWTNDYQNFR
jgi:hypothetical protein